MMGENVTYADLLFSKPALGHGATPQVQGAAMHEVDSAYENLHLGAVGEGPAGHGAQQRREPRWSAWPLPLALLAACLALLATTIALGVCYWQERQRLQQASHAHAAERDGLWQQADAQEQQLGQAQERLAQTQAELAWEREKGNRSQMELGETTADLEQAQKLAWDLQQQLNKTARALATARSCQVTGCCPETWVLHCGKCLFLSKEKKSWKDSKAWCEQESSKLLILRGREWDQTKMPSFLTTTNAVYWIGLQYKGTWGQWSWIDGTPHPKEQNIPGFGSYGVIEEGSIKRAGMWNMEYRWICEKPASCPW
ncbi:C-type lectin domain family 1 member A-like [Alligator sinensis]|uniref:C-type lectin domain family 1 member A-like n=1 Tax=Alligator sinensis TaxID=38654 RepID=A0A1U8DQ47_ALLSI|nr:C-type lectin domain family 1 member A-like [Alligator sinensis]